MKKLLKSIFALTVGFAVIAFSCTSCKREDIIGMSNKNSEILFGSKSVNVEVKSFVETNNTLLQTNGFKVAAVIDADNSVMFNSAVSYNSGDAVYRVPGSHYYFPSEGTMSFYGVYPATQTITIDGGAATISYSHNTDTDLVAAKSEGLAKQSAAVLMEFDHLLSQVSIKAKGENTGVDYKLKSVKIANANGGTYSFTDDSWTPGSTTAVYTVYDNTTGMTVSTSGMTDVGSAMSFIPGTVSLNVVWECYNKGTSNLISSNDQSVEIELVKGKHLTLNLTLPSNSSDLMFVTSVGGWVDAPENIVVKPKEFVFTVNDEGKKVKFAKGNLYWNGSEFRCEENQYDFPTAWNENHVGHFFWSKDASIAVAESYSDDEATVEDKFFAADGGAIEGLTVLSKDEWQYLIDHSLHTEICEEVKMYQDADNGDRLWSFTGTEAQARAAFDANTVVRENYEGKSFDELLNNIITALETNSRNIARVGCVILKPDGFTGEIQESYTASEWAEAEAAYGLVALPLAGCRDESDFYYTGYYGHCWSFTPGSDYSSDAYEACFSASDARASDRIRNNGCTVRLVSVQ